MDIGSLLSGGWLRRVGSLTFAGLLRSIGSLIAHGFLLADGSLSGLELFRVHGSLQSCGFLIEFGSLDSFGLFPLCWLTRLALDYSQSTVRFSGMVFWAIMAR